MSHEPHRAVLWDLDGTLVDSRDHHWHAWRDTMRGEGVELTYEQFLASFGQKNDRILAAWLGGETPAHRVQRIGDAKEALYREHARREGVTLLPGALDWVHRLNSDGWLQAIASSAPRANVEAVLQVTGIADLIDAIVSAEDVTAGKPDPQVFLDSSGPRRRPTEPLRRRGGCRRWCGSRTPCGDENDWRATEWHPGCRSARRLAGGPCG